MPRLRDPEIVQAALGTRSHPETEVLHQCISRTRPATPPPTGPAESDPPGVPDAVDHDAEDATMCTC
jgi:hypothetical protein